MSGRGCATHPGGTLDELRRQRDERDAQRATLHGDAVKAELTGTAQVTGDATITVKVEASSSLLQVVEQARTALKLAGQLNTSGPGSTGHSSPDAAAPPSRGSTGGASGSW
jgi:hypothetical protein